MNPVETLERWEQFGASWRVVADAAGAVTISLCRCDGGEEVERLTSSDPELFAWLGGRTSSEQPPVSRPGTDEWPGPAAP